MISKYEKMDLSVNFLPRNTNTLLYMYVYALHNVVHIFLLADIASTCDMSYYSIYYERGGKWLGTTHTNSRFGFRCMAISSEVTITISNLFCVSSLSELLPLKKFSLYTRRKFPCPALMPFG